MLHVALGEFIGLGSILPFSFDLPTHSDLLYNPAFRDCAWEIVILSLVLPYLCRRDIAGTDALWLNRVDIGLMIALPVGAFLATMLFDDVIASLAGPTPPSPTDDIKDEFVGRSGLRVQLWTLVFLIVIVGPVVEELVFRGIFYSHIRARLGPAATIGITGALFGLLHGGPPTYALSIVFSGLVFGLIRERTGGVTAPIAAHIFNNLIVTLDVF